MTGPPNSFAARPSRTDYHFVSTASCVKTTLALPTKKLGCHETETNISSAYEDKAIFSRRKLVILLELIHLKMEVTVSEPCDVIRVPFNVIGLCDAFNIYLGWKYFHPHFCRCHLANRDHCGNKILSLDFFQCFYPWWQVWWNPVFIYGDVFMYFSLNKAIQGRIQNIV